MTLKKFDLPLYQLKLLLSNQEREEKEEKEKNEKKEKEEQEQEQADKIKAEAARIKAADDDAAKKVAIDAADAEKAAATVAATVAAEKKKIDLVIQKHKDALINWIQENEPGILANNMGLTETYQNAVTNTLKKLKIINKYDLCYKARQNCRTKTQAEHTNQYFSNTYQRGYPICDKNPNDGKINAKDKPTEKEEEHCLNLRLKFEIDELIGYKEEKLDYNLSYFPQLSKQYPLLNDPLYADPFKDINFDFNIPKSKHTDNKAKHTDNKAKHRDNKAKHTDN